MSGQMTHQQILDFYQRPAAMTHGRGYAPLFDKLPRDVAAVADIVQGLLLHEHWAPRYGSALSDEQRRESQIRAVAPMLDRLFAHDGRPLSTARPVEARLVGICRHFTVLLVAMLRVLEYQLGLAVVSLRISMPVALKTTGSANTGTRSKHAGCSSMRR